MLLRREFEFKTKEVSEASRSFDIIASTPAIDSYGEVLVQDWDLGRYQRNPIVLWGHRADELPIGTASDVRVEDGALRARITFADESINPLAEQVLNGVRAGIIRGISVGFKTSKAEPRDVDGRTVFVLSGNELIEISVVGVPANSEAAIVGVKEIRYLKALASGRAVPEDNTARDEILEKLEQMADREQRAAQERDSRLRELETERGQREERIRSLEADAARLRGDVTRLESELAAAKPPPPSAEEQAAEGSERFRLIAQGRRERRLVPALLGWAQVLPLEHLRAFVNHAPELGFLKPGPREDVPSETELRWRGRTYSELAPMEKDRLYRKHPEVFRAMRAQAQELENTQ